MANGIRISIPPVIECIMKFFSSMQDITNMIIDPVRFSTIGLHNMHVLRHDALHARQHV